jgi:hypothetical protein
MNKTTTARNRLRWSGTPKIISRVDLPWSASFEDPIPLPNSGWLLTLRDDASYITKLPEPEHSAPEWQAMMEALILVAENGGPTMLARIGMFRPLNAGKRPRTV